MYFTRKLPNIIKLLPSVTEAIVQSTSVHTTTSTPQQNCDDLTGRWESRNPTSIVCVEEYETGDLLTLMRNGTDLYYQIVSDLASFNNH